MWHMTRAAEQAAGLQAHMRKTNPLRPLGESCDESS